jgi:hypothetical protein
MSKLNFNTVPEAIGTEKSRYLWDASRTHLFPALLALLHIREVRYLAIIGDKGFCITRYNAINGAVLEQYVQPFDKPWEIRKEVNHKESEESIYLYTTAKYTFYAPYKKMEIKLVYNANDARLEGVRGLKGVRAMHDLEHEHQVHTEGGECVIEKRRLTPHLPKTKIKIRNPFHRRDKYAKELGFNYDKLPHV